MLPVLIRGGEFSGNAATHLWRMDAPQRRLAGQAATRTLAALAGGGAGAAGAWTCRGLSWRRAVLAAVVLHPCLRGRNVFDPSRVEVVWRT
jgi:hypothetical protein